VSEINEATHGEESQVPSKPGRKALVTLVVFLTGLSLLIGLNMN
jgi:hypothetical protein